MPEAVLHAAAVRLDPEGVIVGVDPEWDLRLRRYGATALLASEVIGRPVGDFLSPNRAEAWLQFLGELRRAEGVPPISGDPLLANLCPWPASDGGTWLRLDGRRAQVWLRRPILRVHKGRVDAFNDAARRLLDGRPELAELRRLESFLAARQPPLRLVPFRDVRVDGRPLFRFRQPPPFDVGAFDVLARLTRAGLHDLSNPLSALRMMADVSALGGGLFGAGAASVMPNVTEHLDAAIDTIHDMRSLIYADGSVQELNVVNEARGVIGLLRSEFSRREVEVSLDAPEDAVAVAGVNAFRLLLASGLLSTTGRAPARSRVVLQWVVGLDTQQLSCHVFGDGPARWGDGEPRQRLLHELASTCDARLTVAPGERPDADPDWQVELADG
ncbi:MAG: hypothetical protein AAGM22_01740 [Acidobacteriota bacterium]